MNLLNKIKVAFLILIGKPYTVYKLIESDGYAGDEYYMIPNEKTLGYYTSRKEAESHPKYKAYIQLQEKISSIEAYGGYADDYYMDNNDYYVYITEVKVL